MGVRVFEAHWIVETFPSLSISQIRGHGCYQGRRLELENNVSFPCHPAQFATTIFELHHGEFELNGLIEVYSRASTQAADEKSSKAYFNVSIQVNFNVGRSDCKGPKAAVRTGIRG